MTPSIDPLLPGRINKSRKMLWGWLVSVDIGKVDAAMTEAIAEAELGALGTLCENAPPDEFDQLLVLIRDWEALRLKMARLNQGEQ